MSQIPACAVWERIICWRWESCKKEYKFSPFCATLSLFHERGIFMKITEKDLTRFPAALRAEERSPATIEKYCR